MPNQPKTPKSSFRIPADIKQAAQARAKAEGRTLTDIIIAALIAYNQKEATNGNHV